jgi:hypothetical protein
MIEQILDMEKWLGLEKSFAPNYQFENPLEFNAIVGYYMGKYFDEPNG